LSLRAGIDVVSCAIRSGRAIRVRGGERPGHDIAVWPVASVSPARRRAAIRRGRATKEILV
jgi:hypothetical protein